MNSSLCPDPLRLLFRFVRLLSAIRANSLRMLQSVYAVSEYYFACSAHTSARWRKLAQTSTTQTMQMVCPQTAIPTPLNIKLRQTPCIPHYDLPLPARPDAGRTPGCAGRKGGGHPTDRGMPWGPKMPSRSFWIGASLGK